MDIRKAVTGDWEQILAIYQRARDYMRQTGNPNQWQTSRPDPNTLAENIANGLLYVLEESGVLHGVFALISGADPTYNYIDGNWLNDEPYAAIHRVASAGLRRGVLGDCLSWCGRRYKNLRIDTHNDNRIMQHLLTKHGFTRCGIIYLENGEPRIAYHRIAKGC